MGVLEKGIMAWQDSKSAWEAARGSAHSETRSPAEQKTLKCAIRVRDGALGWTKMRRQWPV